MVIWPLVRPLLNLEECKRFFMHLSFFCQLQALIGKRQRKKVFRVCWRSKARPAATKAKALNEWNKFDQKMRVKMKLVVCPQEKGTFYFPPPFVSRQTSFIHIHLLGLFAELLSGLLQSHRVGSSAQNHLKE